MAQTSGHFSDAWNFHCSLSSAAYGPLQGFQQNSPVAVHSMFMPALNEEQKFLKAAHESGALPSKGMRENSSGLPDEDRSIMSHGEIAFSGYLQPYPDLVAILGMTGLVLFGLLLYAMLKARWSRRLLVATESAKNSLQVQFAVVEALSRDYVNVFAINEQTGTARIVKLGGYITRGLKKDISSPQAYRPLLEIYIRERVHPEDKESLSEALDLATVRKKATLQREYTGAYRILENGEPHYYQFTFVRLGNSVSGKDYTILLGFRNIDEVTRREREQKALLSIALEQARNANAAKTAFLNNMSHDMRTPMNAIIGFTALARDHMDDIALVRSYLDKIMTSGNHLLSLINDVLDMSRIESGKMQIEEKEISLPQLFQDLKSMIFADIRNRKLDFHMEAENVVNEHVFCDRLRLSQILLNMLGNAMKYTPSGGSVNIRIIQTPAADQGRAAFEFLVRDTGIGMSSDFLKNVFEPFEREQTSTVSGIQGTGLGLAITRKLVEMMGGEISVQSEPGKGSEFVVKFSFRVAPNPPLPGFISSLQGRRVLLVENDRAARDSIASMIGALGLQYVCASSGQEALNMLNEARMRANAPGFCLLARELGDMGALELARRMHEMLPAGTPLILMTALDPAELEDDARAAGIAAFCPKPVFTSALAKALEAIANSSIEKTPPGARNFEDKRILLVEDNEMNQEIAQMILEDAGFSLDIAENGQQALECVSQKDAGFYDVILMDVQMPVMNGYEATRQIRRLPGKGNVPIIAMTANAFAEDRAEALNAGMDGHIPKPIDIKLLLQTLASILEKAGKGQSS